MALMRPGHATRQNQKVNIASTIYFIFMALVNNRNTIKILTENSAELAPYDS